MTEPTWASEYANPDIVLQHIENPELSVWIARFPWSHGFAHVLTCWDFDRQMHFEVPKETVTDVLEQVSENHYRTFDISNDDILEAFADAL